MVINKTKLEPVKEIRRLNKEIDAYNKDLLSKAKKPIELLVSVYCDVKSVVGYGGQPNTNIHWPWEISDSFLSNLEIIVDSKTPIKKIVFNGWPPIEKGDNIIAYIFKGILEYEKENVKFRNEYNSFNDRTILRVFYNTDKAHFVERKFKEEEGAVKIEKLRENGVVATYTNDIYLNKIKNL